MPPMLPPMMFDDTNDLQPPFFPTPMGPIICTTTTTTTIKCINKQTNKQTPQQKPQATSLGRLVGFGCNYGSRRLEIYLFTGHCCSAIRECLVLAVCTRLKGAVVQWWVASFIFGSSLNHNLPPAFPSAPLTQS